MPLLSIVYNHYQEIVQHDHWHACHIERFIYNCLLSEVGQYVPFMPYSQEEWIPVHTLASIRIEIKRVRAMHATSRTTRLYKRAAVAAYQEVLDLYEQGKKPAWYVHAENWYKVLVAN